MVYKDIPYRGYLKRGTRLDVFRRARVYGCVRGYASQYAAATYA